MPFSPLALHRIAHRLHKRGWRRSARVVQGLIYFVFTALIPPEVEIGERVQLKHNAFGVVFHPHTVIGNDVIILHHVTLGTDTPAGDTRRLVIGDGVMIGAGACVLGPINIGARALIGAGAVVTKDVPEGAVVTGNPARVVEGRR